MISDGIQPKEYAEIEWPSQARPERVSVIHLLMVHPCATGKGVGSALVSYALDEAKRRSFVAVRPDAGGQNTPAASLYKRLGFQVVANSTMNVGAQYLMMRIYSLKNSCK